MPKKNLLFWVTAVLLSFSAWGQSLTNTASTITISCATFNPPKGDYGVHIEFNDVAGNSQFYKDYADIPITNDGHFVVINLSSVSPGLPTLTDMQDGIIRVNNTSGSYFFNWSLNQLNCLGPLPVKIISFSVDRNFTATLVTADESQMHMYYIERNTTDGGVTFQTIATITPRNNGSGQNTYQYTDATPHCGRNFYRAKLVEQSGNAVYSTIYSVTGANCPPPPPPPPPPPVPTFSLSPTSVEVECRVSSSFTFTTGMSFSTTASVDYLWYVGPGNGWLYNGNPAPTVPFYGPASITLTSSSSGTTFPAIEVTPIVGGVAQPVLTTTTKFKKPNLGIVGGNTSICSGTSSYYYLYGAPSGSSYWWGTRTLVPNYGATVVTVDNPRGYSTTLTKIGDGIVNLTASVTDGCNQTYPVTRENIFVGSYANTTTISGYMLAYPPCYTQGCYPSPVSNNLRVVSPYSQSVYTAPAYIGCENYLNLYNTEFSSGTWSLVSGSVSYWYTSSGTHLTFYPWGTGHLVFRLTASTSCGTVYYDFSFDPVQYSQYYYYYYSMSPNPATSDVSLSVDEEKLSKEKPETASKMVIQKVVVLDKFGKAVMERSYPAGTKKVRFNISTLPKDIYMVRIFNGEEWIPLKLIKD